MSVTSLEKTGKKPAVDRLASFFGKFLGKNPQQRSKLLFCYAMLTPIMLLFFYIRIYPILRTLFISFFNWDYTRRVHPFIGITNYQIMLTDSRFLDALRNTAVFSVATVLLSIHY